MAIGLALVALALTGHVTCFLLGAEPDLVVLCWVLQGIGGFLIMIGSEAAVADDFIKIGLTKIPKNRVTLVHMGENATRVHWDGKWGRARSYLFARTSYHPDDWVLLQDHLHALGVSHVESPANSGPRLVEY